MQVFRCAGLSHWRQADLLHLLRTQPTLFISYSPHHSTEFISRMRVDDSVVLEDYKEISDTWRNKYNDPIQVMSCRWEKTKTAGAHSLRPKAHII